jgi:hypothetical protein
MSLLSFFRKRSPGRPDAQQRRDAAPIPSVSVSISFPDLESVVGTTTWARENLQALAEENGFGGDGFGEFDATLRIDVPGAPSSQTVCLVVDGRPIGSLPFQRSQTPGGSPHIGSTVRVQVFTTILENKGFRAEAWVWLGQGKPEWEWSEDHRPPLSLREKAVANQKDTEEMVRDGLSDTSDPERARSFRAGLTPAGRHYLELVEPIKQLKREGRLDEALMLCMDAVEAAENEAAAEPFPSDPAPWYTEQAAIILRKMKRKDEEIEVLQRWFLHLDPEANHPTSYETLRKRLDKLQDPSRKS